MPFLDTRLPENPDAPYWKSACEYEKRLCAEIMRDAYPAFLLAIPDSRDMSMTWREFTFRLRRVRSLFLSNRFSTPEELVERFYEPLPAEYGVST